METVFAYGRKSMRLDKYLKVSRLIKRRSIANEACDHDRVLVNGKAARASYAVKVGDRITIQLGARVTTVEVQSIVEHAPKDMASAMYREL
jgi:ribosomal 50S subunit-recycling heat shock protein